MAFNICSRAGSEKDLISSIKTLQQKKDLDALLIFRGGGSAADLSVFSEYEVAKAVCKAKLPVFTAVGHQEDESSVQDVSFMSFGVPKDLGHYFASIVIDLRREFASNTETIADLAKRLLSQYEKDFVSLSKNIFSIANKMTEVLSRDLARFKTSFPKIVNSYIKKEFNLLSKTSVPIIHLANQLCEFNANTVMRLFDSLLSDTSRFVSEKTKEIDSYKRFFDSISPQQQLERGFAIVRDSKNKVLTRAKQIDANMNLKIEFADKSIEVKHE